MHAHTLKITPPTSPSHTILQKSTTCIVHIHVYTTTKLICMCIGNNNSNGIAYMCYSIGACVDLTFSSG